MALICKQLLPKYSSKAEASSSRHHEKKTVHFDFDCQPTTTNVELVNNNNHHRSSCIHNTSQSNSILNKLDSIKWDLLKLRTDNQVLCKRISNDAAPRSARIYNNVSNTNIESSTSIGFDSRPHTLHSLYYENEQENEDYNSGFAFYNNFKRTSQHFPSLSSSLSSDDYKSLHHYSYLNRISESSEKLNEIIFRSITVLNQNDLPEHTRTEPLDRSPQQQNYYLQNFRPYYHRGDDQYQLRQVNQSSNLSLCDQRNYMYTHDNSYNKSMSVSKPFLHSCRRNHYLCHDCRIHRCHPYHADISLFQN